MRWSKDFWIAALIRAVRTGAQVLLSAITVGAALSDIDWVKALSVAAVAMIASMLTSIVTGLPESKIDGFIEPGSVEDIDEIKEGDIVRFKVKEGDN